MKKLVCTNSNLLVTESLKLNLKIGAEEKNDQAINCGIK